MGCEVTQSVTVTRLEGVVARLGPEYGFIGSDSLPEASFYFKTAWYRGTSPLRLGDAVTFEMKDYGDGKFQANRVAKAGEEYCDEAVRTPLRAAPTSVRLLDWAHIGRMQDVLENLRTMALKERWEFLNTREDPMRPYPILHSYLVQTFARLTLENKVLVTQDGALAAFNTGLVDFRYEPIHALFGPTETGSPWAWKLMGFCIPGEGPLGQRLVRSFKPLPQAAHYFDELADLIYDVKMGEPEIDWPHVVIDRIGRYPTEFLEDHWPESMEHRDPSSMTKEEASDYWTAVGNAIEDDKKIYRRIMNRVRDAVELSIKRTAWNFKTAVPQYYPPVRKLQLLLPICLVEDEKTDMALAVEITGSGSYLAHTVLPLDWAYKNARLICRPDSDWLDAEEIAEEVTGTPGDQEDASDR